MPNKTSSFSKVSQETNQTREVRLPLIRQVEKYFNKRLLAFQTSFTFENGGIADEDAQMMEELLLASGIRRNLLLMISSPGGFGLAAERIVNVCRKFSGNNFEVLVPRMAKSAGTLVCFGAKKIWMGRTSELGPVDPQLISKNSSISVHNILKSYKGLMTSAENTKGRIEPYLQQLRVYDPRYIAQLEQEVELSKKMPFQLLKTGMMKGKPQTYIEKRIKIFLDPEETLQHGRPIYADQAKRCGLNIGIINLNKPIWKAIWELQLRYDHVTNRQCGKLVESSDDTYMVHGHMSHDADDEMTGKK